MTDLGVSDMLQVSVPLGPKSDGRVWGSKQLLLGGDPFEEGDVEETIMSSEESDPERDEDGRAPSRKPRQNMGLSQNRGSNHYRR